MKQVYELFLRLGFRQNQSPLDCVNYIRHGQSTRYFQGILTKYSPAITINPSREQPLKTPFRKPGYMLGLTFLIAVSMLASCTETLVTPTRPNATSKTAALPGSSAAIGSTGLPVRDASADSVFSKEFINLYNKYRESKGRSPLNFDEEVNSAAVYRAAEIRDAGYTPKGNGAVWEYVIPNITLDESPNDLVSDMPYQDWMTSQMLLDWYPKAGFGKVGEIAVLLLGR